jgi:hypothetical protein
MLDGGFIAGTSLHVLSWAYDVFLTCANGQFQVCGLRSSVGDQSAALNDRLPQLETMLVTIKAEHGSNLSKPIATITVATVRQQDRQRTHGGEKTPM